jgi:hypothetical protein
LVRSLRPKDNKIGCAFQRSRPGGNPAVRVLASPRCLGVPRTEIAMRTLAQSAYIESEFGILCELPSVGTPLENPYVYDASARELKAMASQGLVRIVEERSHRAGQGELISRLTFERLR